MSSNDNPFLRLVRLVFVVGGFVVLGEAVNAFRQDVPELSYFILLLTAITLSLPYFKLPLNITECLFFLVVIAFQPSAAIIFSSAITIIGTFPEFRRDKFLFLTSIAKSALSAGAAVLVYQSLPIILQRLGTNSPSQPMIVLNTLAWMAWIRFLMNLNWSSVIKAIRFNTIKSELAKGEWFSSFVPYFASAVVANIVCLAVGLQHEYTTMFCLLIVTTFTLTYISFKQKYISIRQSAEEVSELHLRTIEVLASAIGAKDDDEKTNTQRIQIFAEGMGGALGLSVPELKALRGAVALRDIGHLAVPDYILQKSEVLTEAEQDKIRLHPVVSANILERIGFPYPLVPAVRHHHENWDGTGFPDQLKGSEIPVTARILAIASAFESVYCESGNPGARALAIQMLLRESDRKFDRHIVEIFLEKLPELENQLGSLSGNSLVPSLISQGQPELIPTNYLKAIRSARLEATELFEMAQTLSSTLNVEEAVSIIVSRLSRLIPCKAHALYLYDENAEAIYLRGAVGSHAEQLDAEPEILDLVKKTLINGQPELCPAPLINKHGEPIFSVIAIYPLSKAGKNIGAFVLCTESEEGFSADHLRISSLVAPLAADALFNSMAYRDTEARALTDALTQLPNSRFLAKAFEQEVTRAERYGNTLAMLMFDLDGFKQINDTYGHAVGDEVLRKVAKCLKQELRAGDALVRYGGDEFVALLPYVEAHSIGDLIYRIQTYLEKYQFKINGLNLQVAASIGYAIFGKDGRSLEDLMKVADSAMYRNKASRSRVVKAKFKSKKAHQENKKMELPFAEAIAS